MPITETGQGNSDNTRLKQETFTYLMAIHTRVVASIVNNPSNPWASKRYWYFDLNAGTGKNADGTPGSFLIAIMQSNRARLDFMAAAIDNNPKAINALRKNIIESPACYSREIAILKGDNNKWFSTRLLDTRNPLTRYGMVYTDPNGPNGLPLDALSRFFASTQYKHTGKIDVLFSIGATHIKRCRQAGLPVATIEEIMRRVQKKFWFIRSGFAQQQWTMILGTNWNGWPKHLKINTEKAVLPMYTVDSELGRQTLRELSLTATEKQNSTKHNPYNCLPDLQVIRKFIFENRGVS